MLPSPLPDDPRKWDGWKHYESTDLYERLCLSFEENPSQPLIEENCRQLLVWWQKKLPLKNQPSNPLAQMLRAGIDQAPRLLSEARTVLLNPESRGRHDTDLGERRRQDALAEFQRFLNFSLGKGYLTDEDETHLYRLGRTSGLSTEDMRVTVEEVITRTGARRQNTPTPAESQPAVVTATAAPAPAGVGAARAAAGPRSSSYPVTAPSALPSSDGGGPPVTRRVRREADPGTEFKRMLRLSGLDENSITDDQRDAFVNMAENLGLEADFAEDLIDEYLDEMQRKAAVGQNIRGTTSAKAPSTPKTPSSNRVIRPGSAPAPAGPGRGGGGGGGGAPVGEELTPNEERARYPNFENSLGCQLLLIPSAQFVMGNSGPDAPPNETPAGKVALSRYFISRHPITNEQYEKFEPIHRTRRGPKSGDQHPVISVSYLEAIKFCQWLSAKERRRYRLPTEAEWEYAARGADGRPFPWGTTVGRGNLANFADANTKFPWSDAQVDDGWAETAPVGSYPLGASPFGLEDCAGNVWEWCLDFYAPYKTGERTNPRGPTAGKDRVYRGGSWKSRFGSLKTTTRGFNQPTYASYDVGFRVVCEPD